MKHFYKLTIFSFLVFFTSQSFTQNSNYVKLYTPFNDNSFSSVDVDKNGTIWCGSDFYGLYEFKNDTWVSHFIPSNMLDLALDQNDNVWVCSFGGYAALFDGAQFDSVKSPLNPVVEFIIVNTNGDVWTGGVGNNIAKYDGTTWTTFDSIYSNTGNMALKRTRSFAKDSKGNIYFANMSDPRINTVSEDYVLVKYDGQNFNVLTTQSAEVPSWLLHVIAVDSNDNIWFGNRYNYLVEYNGQNFQYFTPPQNMPLGAIWAVTVDNYNQKWLAADSGIYKYYNNQWTEYKYRDLNLIRGKPGHVAFDLVVDKNNNLWLATNWGMVQFNPNGIVTDVDDEKVVNIPKEFILSQNYPNPFNPETAISYQLPANSFVSLKVFDTLGREVATLVNEEKPAGTYTINFNAEGLSSGVYFYKMRAGRFVQTKKLVLMK